MESWHIQNSLTINREKGSLNAVYNCLFNCLFSWFYILFIIIILYFIFYFFIIFITTLFFYLHAFLVTLVFPAFPSCPCLNSLCCLCFCTCHSWNIWQLYYYFWLVYVDKYCSLWCKPLQLKENTGLCLSCKWCIILHKIQFLCYCLCACVDMLVLSKSCSGGNH